MIYPFIFSLIASISTLIGTIPIFIKKYPYQKIISLSLSFASGVMITMSIIDLIPEGIKYLKTYNSSSIITAITIIILGNLTIYFLSNSFDKLNNNTLYNTGILSVISIIIHNIPEGIITYLVTKENITLGFMIMIAITLHNIPEGISISVPIYFSTKSKFKAILLTLVSGISEFIGALMAHYFIAKYINNYLIGMMLIFTAGIMIGISLLKLIPNSITYDKKIANMGIIIGMIFITISLLINSLVF